MVSRRKAKKLHRGAKGGTYYIRNGRRVYVDNTTRTQDNTTHTQEKTYRGKKIQTDWKGNKYVVLKGNFIKLNRYGKPRFYNKREMRHFEGSKF